MQAYRIETEIEKNGSLILKKLPFHKGEKVEVIILESSEKGMKVKQQPHSKSSAQDKYPLRGTSVKYENPTDPVGESDWKALK